MVAITVRAARGVGACIEMVAAARIAVAGICVDAERLPRCPAIMRAAAVASLTSAGEAAFQLCGPVGGIPRNLAIGSSSLLHSTRPRTWPMATAEPLTLVQDIGVAQPTDSLPSQAPRPSLWLLEIHACDRTVASSWARSLGGQSRGTSARDTAPRRRTESHLRINNNICIVELKQFFQYYCAIYAYPLNCQLFQWDSHD
jgi:hypothetical protein